MRYIDMQNWPRRKHFEFFNTFDYPHFSICANVNITAFDTWIKKQRFSFTVATVYALARAANKIREFRYRIRNNQFVEHELVHPSPTILTGDDLFSFSTIRYVEDFTLFSERAEQIIEHRKKNPTLEDEPGQDDLLFMKGTIKLELIIESPMIIWQKCPQRYTSISLSMGLVIFRRQLT